MSASTIPVGPRTMVRLAPGADPPTYTRFSVEPVGVTIGGFVHGLDLRQPLDDGAFAELRAALLEWKVLFLREQHLTVAQQAAVAVRFGDVADDHLVISTAADPVDNVVVFTRDAQTVGLENGWHTDGTFRPMPTMGTMLRAIEVPAVGGDTLFADMAAAYDNLSDHVRARIAGLRARHDWSLGGYAGKYAERLEELRAAVPPVEHPVVIRHPDTGRPTLFVNRLFTDCIVGLDRAESDDLLDHLCRHIDLPEVQVRLHWEPGTIALWDNVAVQHYGANDYFPQRRVMARATWFSREHHTLDPAAPRRPNGAP
jgi:taurine dioxygenase